MNPSKNIAEQLGYLADAKLLIVHADDLGMSHSANEAGTSALKQRGINSASIMVPTPWFPEIAHFAKKNPGFDLGIHLTLTSEWNYYKWGGVLPSNEISSLLTPQKFFYSTVDDLVANANPSEVEKEIRAQIDRAYQFGLQPTHIDSHMGSLFSHPAFFDLYLKVGMDYNLPVLIPDNWIQEALFSKVEYRDEMLQLAASYPVHVLKMIMLDTDTSASDWFDAYDNKLKNLDPGLNEVVLHPAYADAEMKAITVQYHHNFDADWRQRDFDYFTGQRFKDLCRTENIQLLTWREIKDLIYPESD